MCKFSLLKFKKIAKRLLAVVLAVSSVLLCGCAAKEYVIDFEGAEDFEAALNRGEDLVGKTVRFKADEIHPQSVFGYNIFAGEHLNFVSSENPNVQAGDTVIARITKVESVLGSWIISYKKLSVSKGANSASGNSMTVADNSGDKKTAQLSSTARIKPDKCELSTNGNSITDNDFFSVEDMCFLEDGYSRSLVLKISAKTNAVICSSAVLYDSKENVVGKDTDDIVISAGRNNYFVYDVSDEFDCNTGKIDITATAETIKEKYENELNAVTMEKCNVSGDYLYVTVKQAAEKIYTSGRCKLLFYKDDAISGVYSELLYSTKLNGKNSTDVISVSLYDYSEFDSVEFIYQAPTYEF